MNKHSKFVLAITFQVVIIFAIIIFKLAVLAGGSEVYLKVAPVDPTSPLRGDYASFRYDISHLSPYLFNEMEVKYGDTVYVFLKQSGKYWTPETATVSKPKNVNRIFIKGKVVSGGTVGQTKVIPYRVPVNPSILVVYGIEEYFIPEGKGRNFNFMNEEIAVKAAVDENGNAAVKQVYVNGVPWP